ncbi:hypothetical protein ALC60_04643 [Trachymyrmex zeteki]|uniref:Uncharacterized protein n=1 Tax=Mycetomoellerius zeteki TaxID=64791 RepID=A0A151X863_9HYME|nr:hypothetical protein ALC60_04643 [Trachymyrmex zeteki]
MFEIHNGLHITMLLEINKQDRIERDLFDFGNKNAHPSIRGTSVRILLITSSLCWCVAGADCSRNGRQRPPRSRTTTRSRTGANSRHLLRGLSSLRSLLLPLLGESSHGGGSRTVPLQGATSGSSVRHLVDFGISRYLPSKLINLLVNSTPDEAGRINELNRKSYRRYYPRERNDIFFQQFNGEIKRTIPSFRFFFHASSRRQINSCFATQATRVVLLYTVRSTYSETIMEVLSYLTCSYVIKSGPDFSRRREVWLFGYTTGNPEVNAIVDSFLCLVNGTKKLVNVLTAAKDIGFDPPVTSAYLRLCSLKSEKKRRFAKDASRTCRTSDLKTTPPPPSPDHCILMLRGARYVIESAASASLVSVARPSSHESILTTSNYTLRSLLFCASIGSPLAHLLPVPMQLLRMRSSRAGGPRVYSRVHQFIKWDCVPRTSPAFAPDSRLHPTRINAPHYNPD